VAPGFDQEENHLSIDSSVSTNFISSPGLTSQAVHSDETTQSGEDKISRKVDTLSDTLSGVPRGYPLLFIPTGFFATGTSSPYTRSIRNAQCGSYSERTIVDGAGTVQSAADLGNGSDTIRPVKKVDSIGSLELSAESTGNSKKEATGASRISSDIHKCNESAKAGVSIIEQVILPVIQKVFVSVSPDISVIS